MTVYVDLLMLLNFLVDLFLLVGTNRLAGYLPDWKRAAAAAAVGSIYAGVCLLPGMHFLGNSLWRMVALACMAAIAFGMDRSAVRRGALFLLLSMAMGGIAMGIGSGGFRMLCLAALGVSFLCGVGFHGTSGQKFVPVEICFGGRQLKATLLRDTGNTLRDPLTGQSVMVLDAEAAKTLLGLEAHQLRTPLETMTAGKISGLRLIPYKTVGHPCGMLLAVRCEDVRIGSRRGSALVAFAPDGFGKHAGYQGLVGGFV